MFYISQVGKSDCAFACLTMMLAHFHKDRNYLFLRRDTSHAYSFNEIIKEGEKYGLSLSAISVSNEEEILNKPPLPMIVTLKNKEKKTLHSVILLKVNARRVVIFDPSLGRLTLPYQEFIDKWSKKALIKTNVEKMSCPITPPDFIAKKDKITLPLFQTLSGVSLLFGTYFIQSDAYVFIPIIFFSLFVIFEILFRDNLIKAMRRMDEILTGYSLNADKNQYPDLFKVTEKYRYYAFSVIPGLINACLITFFMMVVLLLNGSENAIYILIAVVLSVFENLIIAPYLKDREIFVGKKEQELELADTQEKYVLLSNEARESSYKIGLFKTAFTYVEIGIMLLIIIFVMAINQIASVTYVVFFLCLSTFLKNHIDKILQYPSSLEEKQNYQVKLLHYLKEDE